MCAAMPMFLILLRSFTASLILSVLVPFAIIIAFFEYFDGFVFCCLLLFIVDCWRLFICFLCVLSLLCCDLLVMVWNIHFLWESFINVFVYYLFL